MQRKSCRGRPKLTGIILSLFVSSIVLIRFGQSTPIFIMFFKSYVQENSVLIRKRPDIFTKKKIRITKKQIEYEFNHLKKKLRTRDPSKYRELLKIKRIYPHPLFYSVKGEIEEWEIISRN